MKQALLVALLSLCSLGGCSVAYDSMRYQQEQNCQQLQGNADREDCLRRSSMSYEEYERQLNARDQRK